MNGLFDDYLLGSRNGLLSGPHRLSLLASELKKRKAYFAFHFDDIMRVNNVRNAWKITHPDSPQMRSFYDSSLWERKQTESSETLKQLIRNGVSGTSVVCVLIGTYTWSRRWVRYEIARSVIDERGLLAVHINGLNHHNTGTPHLLGANPLDYLAVGKVQAGLLGSQYYLFELGTSEWVRYMDHVQPVTLPKYLVDPSPGWVMPLSSGTMAYDYCAHNGHKNIGTWIDTSAQTVGR